jgi:hypothetical protein
MALGDGDGWDETLPTNATLATKIDDHNRDIRKGVRSRMALEHEWPSSQSATSEAGQHKFITLQNQGTQPALSGTQHSALYIKTDGGTGYGLYFAEQSGNELLLADSGGLIKSGLLQVAHSFVQTGTVLTGTALFQAGTTPTTTSGAAFVSKAITPTTADSKLRIKAFGNMSQTSAIANRIGIAIFQDTTAAAKAVSGQSVPSNWNYGGVDLTSEWIMNTPGTTAITFYARVGLDVSGAVGIHWAVSMTSSTPNGTAGHAGIIIEEFI